MEERSMNGCGWIPFSVRLASRLPLLFALLGALNAESFLLDEGPNWSFDRRLAQSAGNAVKTG